MTRKLDARVGRSTCIAAQIHEPRRKRAGWITGIATAFTLAVSFALPAQALTVQEQGWQVANSKCKSGDAKQCVLRDQLSAVLKRHGCVYHDDGDWWKCTGAR
jgi:hypothetical protein